jgi:hypothetical protein
MGAVLGEQRLDLTLKVGAGSERRAGEHADQGDEGVCYEALGRMHSDTLGTVISVKTARMTGKY